MTDEHKLIRDQGRALQASGALENDIIKEAFATLEQQYIDAWRSSNLMDEKGREKLYLAINVIGKVRQHLQTVVNDGKLAEKELQQLVQDNERKKRYGIF